MPIDVAEAALASLKTSGLLGDALNIVWHAGEPLTAGIAYFRELIPRILAFASKVPIVNLNFYLQTNGTLINEEWCALFSEFGITVGLSIDGPKSYHDAHRVDRLGRGTFDASNRGAALLRKNRVKFYTISVITDDKIGHADEIIEFLCNLAPHTIAFNVEEIDGINLTSSVLKNEHLAGIRAFIRSIIKYEKQYPNIRFREVEDIRRASQGGQSFLRSAQSFPFLNVTVDSKGRAYTFSPELAGIKHKLYGDFSIGNVFDGPLLQQARNNPQFKAMWEDIRAGVVACANECSYFRFCGGGSASNKLGEQGSFRGTETMWCQAMKKGIVDVIRETSP
jgi:uncharacterized protein